MSQSWVLQLLSRLDMQFLMWRVFSYASAVCFAYELCAIETEVVGHSSPLARLGLHSHSSVEPHASLTARSLRYFTMATTLTKHF